MNPFTRFRQRRDDDGVALVTTILVVSVIVVLSSTAAVINVNNLQNARRDRQGGSAQNLAEAGLAAAEDYINSSGLTGLKCPVSSDASLALPTSAVSGCSTTDWATPTNATASSGGHVISPAANETIRVWIGTIAAANPPVQKVGYYRIFSTATSGTGPGRRSVVQDIQVTPSRFPVGIFVDTFQAAGDGSIHRESIFSTHCISGRSKINFGSPTSATEGPDLYYGGPAAAHSTDGVTTTNNASASCLGDNNEVHKSTACPAASDNMQWDGSGNGGPLTTGNVACYRSFTDPNNGKTYNLGDRTNFTAADLKEIGYKTATGLTESEYSKLRARAQSEVGAAGNSLYYTSTSGWSSNMPDPAVYPNAVLFFDLGSGGGTVGIQGSDIPAAYGAANCGYKSLIIVVRHGDVHINSNVDLVGSIFVPEGNYQGNGKASIIGTLFAKTVDKFNGTADFYMNRCFLDNFPGGLLNIDATRYHEDDR